jgi:hypothetical protein
MGGVILVIGVVIFLNRFFPPWAAAAILTTLIAFVPAFIFEPYGAALLATLPLSIFIGSATYALFKFIRFISSERLPG